VKPKKRLPNLLSPGGVAFQWLLFENPKKLHKRVMSMPLYIWRLPNDAEFN
jgi:hypothetical protein